MPKLELHKIAVTQLTRLLPQEWQKGRHWSRAHKVSTCMYDVCLCSTARVLRFSIENASKRLDYFAVVYRGAVPAFVSAVIRQEGGLPLSGRRNTA